MDGAGKASDHKAAGDSSDHKAAGLGEYRRFIAGNRPYRLLMLGEVRPASTRPASTMTPAGMVIQ